MGPEELMAQFDKLKAIDELRETAEESLESNVVNLSSSSTTRQLASEEEAFVKDFLAILPPVIARKDIHLYLKGMVSMSTLSHADCAGQGPEKAWKVGKHTVVYQTESLLRWIVARFGVRRVININSF